MRLITSVTQLPLPVPPLLVSLVLIVVVIGHKFNPAPIYNSSYLNGHNQARRDVFTNSVGPGPQIQAVMDKTTLSQSTMSRAGAQMFNNSMFNLSVQSPNNKMLPNSFITALE